MSDRSSSSASAATSDSWLRALTADPRHGRLPILLLALTVVTGVVDAVSILRLGRVFVANMTGNVVFVGFAAAGAPGFSLVASLLALVGFMFGVALAAQVWRRPRLGGARLLGLAATAELVLVLVALAISLAVAQPLPAGAVDSMAPLLAVAMGIQNAVARRLAVPDLTTTVLTMALTGVAADFRDGQRGAINRRILAVVTMFCGAVTGALLVIHVDVPAALAVACGLLAVVSIGTIHAERHVLGQPVVPGTSG